MTFVLWMPMGTMYLLPSEAVHSVSMPGSARADRSAYSQT